MQILRTLTLCFVILISSAHASINETQHKWFMGAEAGNLWYSGYDVIAATIYGGYRWQQFGLDVGYTKPMTNNFNTNTGGEQWVVNNSQNIYIDALGFYELSKKVELIGHLGFGYFKAKIDPLDAYNDWSYRSGGARVGLGVLYKLNYRVQAGAFYILQTTNQNFPSALNMLGLNITYYLLTCARKSASN